MKLNPKNKKSVQKMVRFTESEWKSLKVKGSESVWLRQAVLFAVDKGFKV